MVRWMMAALVALAAWAMPSPAAAEGRMSDAPFATAPVSDIGLSEIRGGQSPFAALTIGAAMRLIDDHSFADLRQTGGVGRIEMDVWWGTTGSELIATSVRAATAP